MVLISLIKVAIFEIYFHFLNQPIPKSGDLSEVGNKRGIILSSLVAKTVNKMILNSIQPKIVKHLDQIKMDSGKGGPPTDTLALRRIIEEFKGNKREAILLFVDFHKVFDSRHRKKWK